MLLPLLGTFLHERSPRAFSPLAFPAAAVAGWWLWLRHRLGSAREPNFELVRPFAGIMESLRVWTGGEQLFAALWVGAAVVLAVLALRRHGLRHPCSLPILLQLVACTVLSIHVIGLDFNGPRATLPLATFALVALSCPRLGGLTTMPPSA